jgi:hypothetical protein
MMMRPEGLMPESVRGTNTSGGGGVDGKRGIGGVSWQTWFVGVSCLPRGNRASHFPGVFPSNESFISHLDDEEGLVDRVG